MSETECWGAQRDVTTLSRRDWDTFITWRRARGNRSLGKNGKPRGGTLRNRIIVQDLRALRTMLRWATQAGRGDGGRLLDRNPLEGIAYPKEAGVRRPVRSCTPRRLAKSANDFEVLSDAGRCHTEERIGRSWLS